MTHHRLRITLVALTMTATALGVLGCGGDDNDGGSGTASTSVTTQVAASDTIGVEASEMKFDLTADTAPAGKVTFNAKNVGSVKHEMVVIKTDTPAADLPVEDGEVDETGSIGEIGPDELTPGASASLKLDMKSGHYALICALPGHYQAGMYKDFSVE